MNECNYLSRIEDYTRNLADLDALMVLLSNKSSEIDGKITMLMNKTVLQLEDSTHLLKFQNTVIRNELSYLTYLKNMIHTATHTQFFDISENITMVAVAYLNIYKDIGGHMNSGNDLNVELKVKMSCKKHTLEKILADIELNMNFIRDLLNDLKVYNNILTGELSTGNFHCATLYNDLEKKYDSIQLEYNKFNTAIEKNITYFTDFTNIVNDHINNTKLRAFCI